MSFIEEFILFIFALLMMMTLNCKVSFGSEIEQKSLLISLPAAGALELFPLPAVRPRMNIYKLD